jgi:hypothetical protein
MRAAPRVILPSVLTPLRKAEYAELESLNASSDGGTWLDAEGNHHPAQVAFSAGA